MTGLQKTNHMKRVGEWDYYRDWELDLLGADYDKEEAEEELNHYYKAIAEIRKEAKENGKRSTNR